MNWFDLRRQDHIAVFFAVRKAWVLLVWITWLLVDLIFFKVLRNETLAPWIPVSNCSFLVDFELHLVHSLFVLEYVINVADVNCLIWLGCFESLHLLLLPDLAQQVHVNLFSVHWMGRLHLLRLRLIQKRSQASFLAKVLLELVLK